MILNGKCKLDFYKFINKDIPDKESFECEMNINDLNYKSKTELNALIIDFFDSKGIIINIINQGLQNWFYYEIKTIEKIKGFNLVRNRQEATEQAIKKANEIYNANN